MLKIYSNILDENEFFFLENECNSFVPDESPTEFDITSRKKNYYFRKFIPENKIFSFYNKILDDISGKKSIKHHINGVWINKINSDSNKNDKYHHDISDLTILIFLNENFEGGEFEYIDENKQITKVQPKKNTAIVMDSVLYHRVLPVTYGERFTLVCFFQKDVKQNKSLI
jgi:hypothetical protein